MCYALTEHKNRVSGPVLLQTIYNWRIELRSVRRKGGPMKRTRQTLLTTGLSAFVLLTAGTRSRAADPGANTAPPQDDIPNTAPSNIARRYGITFGPSPPNTIPYLPTRHHTVKDLLWLADAGTNDVVYDLGSGNGRIVIAAVRDFGARKAVGIELDPQLVRESREKAAQAGLADRVQFIQGDLFTNDFSEASVVVLYLGQWVNLDLRAQLLRALKPGARVVSHQFGMGEWKADKLLDARTMYMGMHSEMWNQFKTNPDVPDFDGTGSRFDHDVLSAWIVPAPVAGVWRGKVPLESREGDFEMTLHQRLSEVSGSFQFHGFTNLEGHVTADLWGGYLRCWCVPTNAWLQWSWIWFEGHATDDTVNGALWVPEGRGTREVKWAGRRTRADFTGTWEWAGPSNSPVQLKIERCDGQLAATYVDKSRTMAARQGGNKPIPVTDIYDFGGGFYFTLLLGRQSNGSRELGPENGWLIGEAAASDDRLAGTIAFYPYDASSNVHPGMLGPLPRNTTPEPQPGRRDWQPTRVAP